MLSNRSDVNLMPRSYSGEVALPGLCLHRKGLHFAMTLMQAGSQGGGGLKGGPGRVII